MNIHPEQVYQTATLLAAVLLFDWRERRAGSFSVDRRRELPLNAAAMLLVIFAGEACRSAAAACLGLLHAGALAGNALTALPSVPKVLLGVVVTDFSLYWVHRAMHGRVLWPAHAFHHSIPEIWWLAGARTSVAHLFLFALPQIFVGRYLLAMTPGELGAAFSFGVVVNLWVHLNWWVDIGPLERVFITPNYHRIHHGAKGLTDRNLGFVFTAWDRLFGTYTDPRVNGGGFEIYAVPTRGRLLRVMAGF